MTPEEVRAIRAAANMTLKEFAAALGSNIRTVQRWEVGERSPRGAAIKLLRMLKAKAKGRKPR